MNEIVLKRKRKTNKTKQKTKQKTEKKSVKEWERRNNEDQK